MVAGGDANDIQLLALPAQAYAMLPRKLRTYFNFRLVNHSSNPLNSLTVLAHKSRRCQRQRRPALQARNMKARGKRGAHRNASPLVTRISFSGEHWKVRNINAIIPLFQSFTAIALSYQGRRTSLRSVLAPRFHIPRL